MREFTQLAYIITISIGLSALVVQVTARSKHLHTGNKLVTQKSLTVFLVLALGYNFCDFLSVFMLDLIGEGVQWIYVFENLLEIIIIYAILDVECKMANMEKPRWADAFFAVLSMVVLFGDSVHSFGYIYPNEFAYALTMFVLNMIPIVLLIVYGLKYGRVMKGTETKSTYNGVLLYNAVCFFLCIVTTATIIDQRTQYDFFVDEEAIYIVFWLIFNSLNFLLVWKTCLVYEQENDGEVQALQNVKPTQDKLAEIAELYSLSDRELEIAGYLLKGLHNKEIASLMFLSPNTVKVHASNLYRKLGVTNRVQAVQALRGETVVQNSDVR